MYLLIRWHRTFESILFDQIPNHTIIYLMNYYIYRWSGHIMFFLSTNHNNYRITSLKQSRPDSNVQTCRRSKASSRGRGGWRDVMKNILYMISVRVRVRKCIWKNIFEFFEFLNLFLKIFKKSTVIQIYGEPSSLITFMSFSWVV
jgi:hypothetical protein